MDLVARIKEILEDIPGTIDQKAKKIGTTSPTLYSYLRGRTAPSFDFLAKIKSVTGVNLNWLVSGEGDKLDTPKSEKVVAIDIEFLNAIRTRLENFTREKDSRLAQIPFYEWSGPLAYQVYNVLIQNYTLETLDTGFETIKPMLDYAIEHFLIFVEGVMEKETLHHMPKSELKEFIETAMSGGTGGVVVLKKNLLIKDVESDGENQNSEK